MRRRSLVLAVAAIALGGLLTLAGTAVYVLTQTSWGLAQVRTLVLSQAGGAVHGKLYVGRLSGSLLGDLTIDSVEIRDRHDSLFVATGPVTVTYDLRDLIDRRIQLRSVTLERPVLRIHERPDGSWNWKEIFPPPRKPKSPVAPTRGFGDYVVIDTATIRGGTLTFIQPWALSDTLAPRVRDSLLAIAQREHELRRAPGGRWEKMLRWRAADAALGRVRLAHPDSVGQLFEVGHLAVEESDPLFSFRDAKGTIRKNDDTLWVDLRHLALAASTGKGRGRIEWGGGKPMRWDVRIEGDSACLSDYAWIYPTLPRTGCGRTDVWIHNEKNLEIMDYELTRLDVRSVKSRLQGKMTFGVGGPRLIVKDVDLTLAPADFDLLRTFKGGPFPYDFQGTLTGRVQGPGGPVDQFVVSAMDLTYTDRHVAGATSRATGRGTLDIERPAEAKFKGFDLDVATADLRTIRYLNKAFPELDGIVRGHVILDSLWYDVRFRDANIEHVDGPGTPTRLLGRGRMTVGDAYTRFDVQLDAQPLSLGMLAQSYPKIPIRVPMSGPLSVFGKADSLAITTTLSAPGGTIRFAGVADAEAPIRGFAGTWTLDSVDVRRLRANDSLPATSLNGRVSGRLAGDTLIPTLEGEVTVALGRSTVAGVRLFDATGSLSFADSVMRVDTLKVETAAATILADGGFGLARPHEDSLRVRVTVDSLGGLRPWLATAAGAAADTLAGTLAGDAWLHGNLDTLDVQGRIEGTGLVRNGLRARRLVATLGVADATAARFTDLELAADTVAAAGLSFVHAAVEARTLERGVTDIALTADAATGPALSTSGRVVQAGDSTVVTLDRGTVVVADEAWTLDGAARLRVRGDDVQLDTLALRGPDGALARARGALPSRGPVDLTVGIARMPLATLARLAGADPSLRGLLDASWHATGTRAAPTMEYTAQLAEVGASSGGQPVRLDLRGTYQTQRLAAGFDLRLGSATLATGTLSLPLDLALEARPERRVAGAPLRGSLVADSVGLGVLQAFTDAIADARGTLHVGATLGGTWAAPRLTGGILLRDGAARLPALGRVQLTDLTADLRLLGDTLDIARLSMRSAPHATRVGRGIAQGRSGALAMTGRMTFTDAVNPTFDLHLTADNFNAVAKPSLADLDVSGDLRLTGPSSGATLVGSAVVNRGTLVIPDLGQKSVVDPTSEEFLRVVDTSLFSDERLLPGKPSAFVNNLAVRDVRIDMGSDVWLRSAEANINLGGRVSVARQRAVRGTDTTATLSLDGTLLVNRGTYRLNIGDVVQRTFDVEQGKVVFSPSDPSFNPGLDIAAVHTVRKLNSSLMTLDKKIRVRIGGTLQQPTLAFESADNAALSQSDLISYLITGGPAFGIGDPTQSSSAVNTAANVLLTSLSSSLADRIASLGYLDYVQIQTAGLDRGLQQEGAPVDPTQQILRFTRIGGGVQLSDRVFLSGDAGLCPLVTQSASQSLWTQLGVRLEYRIGDGFTASASVEPPTQSLLCNTASVRGFALTPQQFGVDLTTAWRF